MHASRTLLAVARTRGAERIIVGSHDLGNASNPTSGRTTEWLLQHANSRWWALFVSAR